MANIDIVPLLVTLFFISCLCHATVTVSGRCIGSERRALLALKADIYQPPRHRYWLSSWRIDGGSDCCTWRGVGCHNETGHVIKLDLRYPYRDYDSSSYVQGPSKLNPSLHSLTYLMYLDVSMKNFYGRPIPDFIGSLTKLEYLNLSNANFGGIVPPQIGNLSFLHTLDLNSDFSNIGTSNYNYVTLSVGNNLHWLSQITSLRYLDMSGVNLSMVSDRWIHELNRLSSLSVLMLSDVSLNSFPATLEHVNFTSLRVLDLSHNNFGEFTGIPNWILNISTLMHLDLFSCSPFINMQFVEMLTESHACQLRFLNLGDNKIFGEIPERLGNLRQLKFLDLRKNRLQGSIPETIGNLSNLQHLDISFNMINGELPKNFGNLIYLRSLFLHDNMISGELPQTLLNLSYLRTLYLCNNNISGAIPETIGNLYNVQKLNLNNNNIGGLIPAAAIASLYCNEKLKRLDLSYNNIGGEVTALVDGLYECNKNRKFSKKIYKDDLWELYLSQNNLKGTIPESLGQLSALVVLDLSFNSFTGVLTENHFSNLTNLDVLRLSYNDLELNLRQNWIPSFNASTIKLCACRLSSKFPAWLQTQTMLSTLLLSEAGISDSIPDWFWDFKYMRYLDLSHNLIKGQLPVLFTDLSYNNFGRYTPMHFLSSNHIQYFSFSHNQLSGSVPLYFCNWTRLRVLDLSNNYFSGNFPSCQNNHSRLMVVDLSNNDLSGHIPDSMGFHTSLQSLHLRNNDLTGKIPWSLKHCKQLVVLDLSENKLSGNIPKWIGKRLSALRVLSLRSNFFCGRIPTQLSHLSRLQVLDLAHNNFSSTLPPSFGNFKAMVEKMNGSNLLHKRTGFLNYYKENIFITTNGLEIEYTKILSLVVSMDISSNSLCGQLPEELTNLLGLHNLNLSGNHLTGKIPDNIGAMKQLESLDLSMNNLSGKIPFGISSLYFLHQLNLSHNNLSGRIPSGYQLQTFTDPSIYDGNFALCGSPLPQCAIEESFQVLSNEEDQEKDRADKNEMIWLCASIVLGFIVGFWGFISTLMIKLSLRIAYYHYIDEFCDWAYVKFSLNVARLKSMMVKNTDQGYM